MKCPLEKSDLKGLIVEWRDCFERILEHANEQLRLLDTPDLNWERFVHLSQKGEELQQAAEAAGEALRKNIGEREYENLFKVEILPIAEEANRVVAEAIERIKAEFPKVTGDLRNTKNHLKIMNAYYGMQSDPQFAYYFDEKK